ncbi:MAG TPA: hypothetical protein VIM73_04895, partial [Polyangiaceae bacterium]
MNKDVISVVEAAYRVESGPAWISGVARAAAEALGLEGAVAVLHDASNPEWVRIEHMELVGVSPEFANLIFNRPNDATKPGFCDFLRKPQVNSVLEEPMVRDTYRDDFQKHGIQDAFAINAGDPSGRGCMLVFPDRRRTHAASWLHSWRRVAAHIAAGNRLRRTLTH